jgi:hypothetical protein
MIILPDSGPLGLLTHSRFTDPPAKKCNDWAASVVQSGHRLVLPRIIDYELRRELNRLGNVTSIARLDMLEDLAEMMEVDAPVLLVASHYWADARKMGVPTADRQHLDIDMILVGHASVMAQRFPSEKVVIATTNVRHLRRFADAREWATIT